MRALLTSAVFGTVVAWCLPGDRTHGQSTVITQRVVAAAPVARRHHALAYDRATKRVLMYGGHNPEGAGGGTMLDDFWSWDGRTWVSISTSTGVPSAGHLLFTDETGALFRVGGTAGATARWERDHWTSISQDSMDKRVAASGAYDPVRKRLVLYGGSVRPRTP